MYFRLQSNKYWGHNSVWLVDPIMSPGENTGTSLTMFVTTVCWAETGE